MMCQGIQSHERSWCKGYIYQNFFKFGIDTSHECASRLIRQCVKILKPDTHIGIWQTLELISYVLLRSLNIPSLNALTEKIDFRNAKNAKVTWSAILRIFNEIWCLYSIPSKILTQMTYVLNVIKIHWKQSNLSSGHQALMAERQDSLKKRLKFGKNTNIKIQQHIRYL